MSLRFLYTLFNVVTVLVTCLNATARHLTETEKEGRTYFDLQFVVLWSSIA